MWRCVVDIATDSKTGEGGERKKMKSAKTVLPIAVVALFLTLSMSSAFGEDPVVDPQDLILEIGYKDNEGNFFYEQIEVAEDEYLVFEDSFTSFESFVDEIDADGIMDPVELLEFEQAVVDLITEIKELTYDEVTGTYAFPTCIGIGSFISEFLFLKGIGRKIFSIGRGRAWLPFNRQGESFIGMRFLPIFIQHTLGYTKVRIVNVIPPSIGVSDRLGIHNFWTVGFAGLYINFGDRYLDRPAGPVVLIGKALWYRLGEDIP